MICVILFDIYQAPYTKVEESFNLQATHDLLKYGPLERDNYDHLQFPGVVPRTFVGPLLIYFTILPFRMVFGLNGSGNLILWQYVVRGVLGTAVAASLAGVRRAVWREFGKGAADWFGVFTVVQFHLMFWASRTLPNMFALVFVNIAITHWIGARRHDASPDLLRICTYLVFTTAVFRCDVILLAAPILLAEVAGATNVTSTFFALVWHALKVALPCIALTLAVDSWFWKQPLYWPELRVLLFNTVDNGSVAYGVEPPYAYVLRYLPKITPLGVPLALYAYYSVPATRRYLIPVSAFVGLYSLLPHKEWRFIIYAVPIINAMSAVAASTMARNGHRHIVLLLKLALIMQCAVSFAMVFVSARNYPGGEALARLDAYLADSPFPPTHPIRAHIDVAAAISGASLFGQSSNVTYCKAENITTADEYWTADYTHLLTATPDLHGTSRWKVIDVVYGLSGVRLYFGGPKAWLQMSMRKLRHRQLTWAPEDGIFGLPLPIVITSDPKIWILERILDRNQSVTFNEYGKG
ncbi:alpha-1,6-mannosyltransferase subunit [Powellomyces hirtus]|nr:alpha-1,6-mannosyltransferase subunit [Powellomyces hirtus]